MKIKFRKTEYSRKAWKYIKKGKYFWCQFGYFLLTIKL